MGDETPQKPSATTVIHYPTPPAGWTLKLESYVMRHECERCGWFLQNVLHSPLVECCPKCGETKHLGRRPLRLVKHLRRRWFHTEERVVAVQCPTRGVLRVGQTATI